jgi:dolichol-phosphate mannosyltransferase
MPLSDVFISVILPVHEASPSLTGRISALHALLDERYANYEIVIIDDGLEAPLEKELAPLLRSLKCLRLLTLSRRFGEEAAIRAGLQSAIGDIVIVMEIGLDPAARIPDLVELCRQGHGIVVGVPETRDREYLGRRLWSGFFHTLNRRLTGTEMYPGSSYFRALSRSALNALAISHYDRLPFRHATVAIGFNPVVLPYRRDPADGVQPHPQFFKDIRQALDVILSESRTTLSIMTLAGLIGVLINAGYLTARFIFSLMPGVERPQWMSVSALHSFFFLLLFVLLTLLGEYIARALKAPLSRPPYIVMSEANSAVEIRDASRRNVVESSD